MRTREQITAFIFSNHRSKTLEEMAEALKPDIGYGGVAQICRDNKWKAITIRERNKTFIINNPNKSLEDYMSLLGVTEPVVRAYAKELNINLETRRQQAGKSFQTREKRLAHERAIQFSNSYTPMDELPAEALEMVTAIINSLSPEEKAFARRDWFAPV